MEIKLIWVILGQDWRHYINWGSSQVEEGEWAYVSPFKA